MISIVRHKTAKSGAVIRIIVVYKKSIAANCGSAQRAACRVGSESNRAGSATNFMLQLALVRQIQAREMIIV